MDWNTLVLLRYFEVPRSRRETISDNDQFTEEQIESFIKFFHERSLLVDSNLDENEIVSERQRERERGMAVGRQIRIVQLVLSNRCNFRCKYCFEGLGSTPLSGTIYAKSSPERLNTQASAENSMMKKEHAEAYLEETIRLVKNAGNKALAIQFFGGEPLINWTSIRHVLNHFGSGEKHGVSISYSIITNGSLITEEIARALREFNVAVVVSYDSPKSDARPLPGGRNSHDIIRHGLEMLSRYGNRVVLNSVLAEATFDTFDRDVVDFAFSNGVYEIGVVLDLDSSFYERRDAHTIVDKVWDVYTYGKSKGVIVSGYWHQIFQGIAALDRYEQIGFKNCSAMGVQLSIEPSGEVFSCKASGGYFGNILQSAELLESETYRRYAMRACSSPEPCRKCPIEHFCAGMCLGPVENKYKSNIYAVVEPACNVYREVTRRLITSTSERHVPLFRLGEPEDSNGDTLRLPVIAEPAKYGRIEQTSYATSIN